MEKVMPNFCHIKSTDVLRNMSSSNGSKREHPTRILRSYHLE
jgi:hypothetical protein